MVETVEVNRVIRPDEQGCANLAAHAVARSVALEVLVQSFPSFFVIVKGYAARACGRIGACGGR